MFADSVLSRVEVRAAKGRMMEALDGKPGDGSSAFWARLPGHLEPSAATLAIIGDYVSGGLSEPLGQRTMGRSLDNTIRVARVVPTEWILCDIHMHALARGIAQGLAYLWSEDGVLLATASQSLSARLWPRRHARLRAISNDRPRSARSVLLVVLRVAQTLDVQQAHRRRRRADTAPSARLP